MAKKYYLLMMHLLKVTLFRLNKTGYETFGGADGQEANDEELIKKAREAKGEVLWKKY